MKVNWTERAHQDAREYWLYISTDNPAAADRWRDKVYATAATLGRHPRMGHVVPEFDDETIRQFVVYSHRIIYRIVGDAIEVDRVWHGARLLHKSDFGEE